MENTGLLKLQPQLARLLLLLVSNPGEIVRREQIQQAVWGDVTMDYDLGVNCCIRQIRSTLLDNPESPRYIRTIPRQSYNFIAPVEQIRKEDLDPKSTTEADDQLEVHGAVPFEGAPPVSGIAPLQVENTFQSNEEIS